MLTMLALRPGQQPSVAMSTQSIYPAIATGTEQPARLGLHCATELSMRLGVRLHGAMVHGVVYMRTYISGFDGAAAENGDVYTFSSI
jgi:hypothetical protein